METSHKKKYGAKEFTPKEINPLPWKLLSSEGAIWFGVVAANGKRVCNCRNVKDAEFIIKSVNPQ